MDFIKLSDVTVFVRNGASIKQNKSCNEGIPVTRIETISNNIFNYDKLGYAAILNDKYSEYYLEDNDVLLSHINSSKFVGRSVIYKKYDENPIIHGMNLLNIRFIQEKYNPEFFVWYTKTIQAKMYFKENTKHAVNQASMTSTAVKNMPIPNIDLEQQNSIALNLNRIYSAIVTKKKLLLRFDELIKSRFIEMFETLDLSEERKEWIEIKDVSKIYTGTTPSTTDTTNWNGDILWVTPAEMNSDTFYVNDTVRKITEKGKKSKSLDLMPVNTVLLSTRAPIGKVGIVGVPMTCNQGFKNFECCAKLNPIYLYTLLKNNTEYLNSLGSGTTFLEVSKSAISKLRIPLPEIELQNKFANFVKKIDKSKFIYYSRYFLCEILTFVSSTIAYSSVVSIFECPNIF